MVSRYTFNRNQLLWLPAVAAVMIGFMVISLIRSERQASAAMVNGWPALIQAMSQSDASHILAALTDPEVQRLAKVGELSTPADSGALEVRIGHMGGHSCRLIRARLMDRSQQAVFKQVQFTLNGAPIPGPEAAEDFDCDAKYGVYALRVKPLMATATPEAH